MQFIIHLEVNGLPFLPLQTTLGSDVTNSVVVSTLRKTGGRNRNPESRELQIKLKLPINWEIDNLADKPLQIIELKIKRGILIFI